MNGNTRNKLVLTVAAGLFAMTLASGAHAEERNVEKERVARYYECCYGPSCHGPRGYARQFYGQCRCTDDSAGKCKCCNCGQCCCRQLSTIFSPGGGCHSPCVDICLYRALFPISPWYSNPRDGIFYPAYGSKSPNCTNCVGRQ